jgi:zinc finger SWIM domain-containing protein 3
MEDNQFFYTDQDAAIRKAIENIFTESYHGLCTFHIMQIAIKHLSPMKDKEKDELEDEVEASHILFDFGACMFGFEDKTTFQEAFDDMRCKVHKQTWLIVSTR